MGGAKNRRPHDVGLKLPAGGGGEGRRRWREAGLPPPTLDRAAGDAWLLPRSASCWGGSGRGWRGRRAVQGRGKRAEALSLEGAAHLHVRPVDGNPQRQVSSPRHRARGGCVLFWGRGGAQNSRFARRRRDGKRQISCRIGEAAGRAACAQPSRPRFLARRLLWAGLAWPKLKCCLQPTAVLFPCWATSTRDRVSGKRPAASPPRGKQDWLRQEGRGKSWKRGAQKHVYHQGVTSS